MTNVQIHAEDRTALGYWVSICDDEATRRDYFSGRCAAPGFVSTPHQIFDGRSNERLILGIAERVAGAMAPDGFDGTEFAVGHLARFDLAVFGGEVEIGC